jgi:hypothetical protein
MTFNPQQTMSTDSKHTPGPWRLYEHDQTAIETHDQYTATKFDYDSIQRSLVEINIIETHSAIVEFIKWYNSQTNPLSNG